jgi:hypothetical protein
MRVVINKDKSLATTTAEGTILLSEFLKRKDGS